MNEVFERLQKKHKEFDKSIKAARQISRNTIYRIVLLSAGIVGFSVSLFSIPLLQQSLNLSTIRYSWYFFITVIILGTFLLLAEGRIRLALTWKSEQVSQWVDSLKDYSTKEQRSAWLIMFWTLIHPSNLTFNKVIENNVEKDFQQRVNGLVVHRLARVGLGLPVIENVLFIVFVLALIFLVKSFVVFS